VPELAGRFALGGLLVLVDFEQDNYRVWQADNAASGV
jgi:hypothetical protein